MQFASSAKKYLFSIGLAVLVLLFINVGINTFYEEPQYPSEVCSPVYKPDGGIAADYDQTACNAAMQLYDEQQQDYRFNVFIISIVAGLVLLVGGYALSKSTIGVGAMFAGVIQFIYGTAGYWNDLDNYMKLLVLGVAISILVYFAYKKFGD